MLLEALGTLDNIVVMGYDIFADGFPVQCRRHDDDDGHWSAAFIQPQDPLRRSEE
jgi:hypothetical protein